MSPLEIPGKVGECDEDLRVATGQSKVSQYSSAQQSMCVCACVELATEFQSVLDKCPSNMAKRWLVLQVYSLCMFCVALLYGDLSRLFTCGSCYTVDH